MPAPSPPGPALVFTGTIPCASVPLLCDRLGELLAESAGAVVSCDVSRLAVNLESVDALARLQVAAQRLGGRLALRGATAELAELLGFCGLAGAFPGSGLPDCRGRSGRPLPAP